MSKSATVFKQSYLHGTKADLQVGDLIKVGHRSNFLADGELSWVYFTATLDTAVWGAELAQGEARQRIYLVEPNGSFENDPNVTDKKFPGNPSLSYRSRDPIRIVAEVTHWQGHSTEAIKKMRDGIEALNLLGTNVIID